jgi:chromatin remodeling complex protein RSC6
MALSWEIADLRNTRPDVLGRNQGDDMAKAKAAKKATKKPAAKKAAAKKPAAKKAPKAAKPAKKAAKRGKGGAGNPAFMKPMQPSEALQAVVGAGPMPRTEITSKVWAYIKKHGLQDPKEKRTINADEALKKVFGGKARVNMFEMTKLVNKHLS